MILKFSTNDYYEIKVNNKDFTEYLVNGFITILVMKNFKKIKTFAKNKIVDEFFYEKDFLKVGSFHKYMQELAQRPMLRLNKIQKQDFSLKSLQNKI